MVKQPLVSIIIPFYNADAYLENAIVSVINQNYIAIEVILIDDGSIDNSHKIAKKYCKSQQNFQLIKTENFGLGAARNLGVKNAKGAFILFLDSL